MSKLEVPAGYLVKKMPPLRPGYQGAVDTVPWLAWCPSGGGLWVNIGMGKSQEEAIGMAIAHEAKLAELDQAVVTA